MFNKKNKNKNQQGGSHESVDSSAASSTENLDSSKDGMDSSKILNQKIQFRVSYLGQTPEVASLNSKRRDHEALLVDKIEESQVKGQMLVTTKEHVTLHISRHGIKVVDINGQDVLQRHPLHTISQIVNYDDGFGKHNIALKIGQVGKTVYQCQVFQCHSEDQAQSICLFVKRIFDAITKI